MICPSNQRAKIDNNHRQNDTEQKSPISINFSSIFFPNFNQENQFDETQRSSPDADPVL